MPSDHDLALADADAAAAESGGLVVRLAGREHRVEYRIGDTILDALRRAGVRAPFNCQQGNCGTCIARIEKGAASMRANNVLDRDEVEAGWVLTCQAVPTRGDLVVEYDV
jgi:ferredoxin